MSALKILVVWVAMVMAGVVQAAPVYRCDQGGRTVYSDVPCEAAKPPVNGVAAPVAGTTQIVGAYDTPYGEWRGQAQFQATANGKRIEAAHSVAQLVMRVAPDGKLIGVASENGCKLLGLVSPGMTPQMLNVDVTLQNCARPEMNKRFHGSMYLSPRDKVTRLQLNQFFVGVGVSSAADVSAVMRR